MPLIDVHNVVKQFRKGPEVITPLQEIDLEVEKGEFVSLMGASGSGKIDAAQPDRRHRPPHVGPDRRQRHRHHPAVADASWRTGGRRTSATSSRRTT